MSLLQGHGTPPAIDPGEERRQRVLEQFHRFPFSSDDGFQQGLSGILAQRPANHLSENERSELILKTKVFYFNRVSGHNISLVDVQAGLTAADVSSAQTGDEDECIQTLSSEEYGEARTLTLAELKRLIGEGKTDNIPNNKIIPNVINCIDCADEEKALGRRGPINHNLEGRSLLFYEFLMRSNYDMVTFRLSGHRRVDGCDKTDEIVEITRAKV